MLYFFSRSVAKKKHIKRRLVNYTFLNELVLRCSSKGSIYFCSDNEDYFKNVKNYANMLKKKMDLKFLSNHTKKHLLL